MPDPNAALSTTQQQVLALIATGSTPAAAALTAGIHRNTIFNWLRLRNFREAFEQAEFDRALFAREQAQALAAAAYDAIRTMIADSSVPAGVRLKAALAMIDRASAPLPDLPEILPNFAQSPTPEPVPAPPPPPTAPPKNLPSFAQSAPPDPKTGRNAPCPCGSGMKFKRCCLGKKCNTLQPPEPIFTTPREI